MTILLVTVAATDGACSIARADSNDVFWIEPISRAAAYVTAVSEDDRPYSTMYRPRDIAGAVATSCEHQEGRPCGDGIGTFGEVDSAAGYRDVADAMVRVRLRTGDSGYRASYDTGVDLDRAHVDASVGPLGLEIGRDVLVLGPRSHTQLGWGDNAPPTDQLRIAVRPFPLGRDDLHGELLYVVGEFRDPQTYAGDLVSIARAQLDLGDRAQIGVMQLLQDEGQGAPHLGLWDFLLENFHRKQVFAAFGDSSNRRFGGDANVRIDGFGGGRIYYEIMFEDIRAKYWNDAIRDDADHLLGVELPAFHDLTIELQKTGVRSQEHRPRLTGFTSEARTVGSPLGPDAQALYATARWNWFAPWIELARLGSDTYTFIDYGPIYTLHYGVAEWRERLGARASLPVRSRTWVDVTAFVEHVGNAEYIVGANRENVGVTVALIWQP